jgi:coenzyme F420-reducing hydrogenase alpha subunit
MRDEKQPNARRKEHNEQRRAKLLVRKVRQRRNIRNRPVMRAAEVLHAILQVAHIAEEVLAKFRCRADLRRRGERGAGEGVEVFEGDEGGRRVASKEGGEHDEVEGHGEGEDAEGVGV